MKNVVVAVALLMMSANLWAAGSAGAGKDKSAVCAACHGPDGVAIAPTYPNLAGQNAEYIVAQLKAFKSGDRGGASAAIMAPMATPLSEQDMLDLAAYFNSLEPAKSE